MLKSLLESLLSILFQFFYEGQIFFSINIVNTFPAFYEGLVVDLILPGQTFNIQ